ncbi:MAG: hypothetical protein L6455_11060 [Kiritimatiellae bacterium]|nr:hypothetical protein [Kiritimatiellia bacterium]
MERGEQNITIESLVKLAKALKCKVMDLVRAANEKGTTPAIEKGPPEAYCL